MTGSWSAGLAQTQLAEQETLQASETVTITAPAPEGAARSIPNAPIQDAYILGPGDAVVVELLDVPEYSGVFTIGPDGTLYLPRLRSLVVEGLTVEELRNFLTQQFSAYVRDPQVFVSPAFTARSASTSAAKWQRPGYYYFSGQQAVVGTKKLKSSAQSGSINLATGQFRHGHGHQAIKQRPQRWGPRIGGVKSTALRLPTVFDALRNCRWCHPLLQA